MVPVSRLLLSLTIITLLTSFPPLDTACNGTTVHDSEMGEVIQLQGDQRKDVHDFLIDKEEGLELDPKTIKVHGF